MAHDEVDVERRHGGHGGGRRTYRNRPAPFIGHWQISFVALPIVGTIFYLINEGVTSILGVQRLHLWGSHYYIIRIGLFNHRLGGLIIGLTCLSALGLAGFAAAYGIFVVRRHIFVTCHVAFTCLLAGMLVWGTTVVGWQSWWLVLHAFGSAFMSFSWNLPRTDVFRADAKKDKDEDKPSKWDAFIGLESEPDMRTLQIEPNSTSVDVIHKGGESLQQVQAAAQRIGSLVDAHQVRTISAGGMGRSRLTIIRHNSLDEWRQWPGLSHPGGSFVDPIRTAYYDTGADEWMFFAPLQKGTLRKTARKRTSILRQGTTGSGKSGDANNEQYEILSRRDATVVAIDTDKFMQNMAHISDMMLMAGDTPEKARDIQRAIKAIAIARQARMARYGFREWGPEAYEHKQCRTCALYLFYDEADSVLGELARWLAAKALAAGIFMSATLPSADHQSLPPRLRRSIGTMKCFGCGDEYSATFTITRNTLKASGIDPFEWKADYPGAHLMEGALNVDPRMYPITARTFAHEHDDARAELLEAREHFEPVFIHPEDLYAAGDALVSAHPNQLPPMGDDQDISAEDLAEVVRNVEREKIRLQTARPLRTAPAQPAQADENEPLRRASFTDEDLQGALDMAVAYLQDRGEPVNADSIRAAAGELFAQASATHAQEGDGERPAADTLADDEDDEFQAFKERRMINQEGDVNDNGTPVRKHVTTRTLQDADPALRAAVEKIMADNPRGEVPANLCGPNVELDDDGTHLASPEEAVKVFNRALVNLAQAGHNTVTNQMILTEIRRLGGAWEPWAVSKQMTKLCAGDAVTPPGVSIRRQEHADGRAKRGQFDVVWEGQPQTIGSNAG